MRNTFGNIIKITLFGESHGEAIGAVIDGLPAGIAVDNGYIDEKLSLRRPSGKISTARVEKDEYKFISGVYNGYTTGAPITVLIENTNKKSCDYEAVQDTPRPSHADFVAEARYGGYQDKRGGGHFSGRITAALVAAGALLQSALLAKGIKIGTHIKQLHGVFDREFDNYAMDIDTLAGKRFPALSEDAEKKMLSEIEKAAAMADSVGGVLESAVIGMPVGVGEPWFDTLEGVIAHALFSVPGVKGVEFGSGFELSDMYGSEANDPFRTDGKRVYTLTNHNGGINGGMSNGMPITFLTAVKPTPSIFKEQQTVNLKTMENTSLVVKGRHDPAIIHRARAVVDAVTAIALCDMLTVRYGQDYLKR